MFASPTSSLSSSARRALRAAAHHLDTVVMMGQHGLTPAVLHEIDLALTAHALIKVRAGSDEREIRDGYLAEICEKLSCESVQHLGKLFVLWRNADGAGTADKSAEQDAAAVKASNDPHAAKERGPRSKLPSERAAERANAAPAGRSGGYASRGGPSASGRGSPSGGRGAPSTGRSDSATGPRWRYGETPPDAPRREGWAPKDRRGAARFDATEGGDDSRRRDGPPSYGAPRARTPGGYAGSSGSTGAGGGEGYRGAAPNGGRSGYGGNSGGGNYGSDNRGASGGGGSNYGGRGRSSSYGGGQGDGAPRARWGERRESSQGGSGFGNSGTDGNSGGGSGGSFGNDRGAPAPRSTYSRGSDAGGADRVPRTGGGGWGNRDGVTGKPTGFSRGGAGGGASGGAGGAAPRARRRFG